MKFSEFSIEHQKEIQKVRKETPELMALLASDKVLPDDRKRAELLLLALQALEHSLTTGEREEHELFFQLAGFRRQEDS